MVPISTSLIIINISFIILMIISIISKKYIKSMLKKVESENIDINVLFSLIYKTLIVVYIILSVLTIVTYNPNVNKYTNIKIESKIPLDFKIPTENEITQINKLTQGEIKREKQRQEVEINQENILKQTKGI